MSPSKTTVVALIAALCLATAAGEGRGTRVSPTCAPGTVSSNGRQPGCTMCTGNTVAQGGGLRRCETCTDNAAPNADHSECLCNYGYAETSSGTCRLCPAGTVSAPDTYSCIPAPSCPVGQARNGAGVCVPIVCPANSVLVGSNCVCNAGFYKTGSTCTACASNQVSSSDRSRCITCTANSAPNAAKDECLCNYGYAETSSGTCALCPAGTVSAPDTYSCICAPGFTRNSAGVCVAINCGAHATLSGSTCSCDANWSNCDGSWSNGCEKDLTAASSCGSCGNACTNGAHVASTVCTAGACAIGSCASGWADCNGVYADGCEYQLNSNAACTSGCPGTGAPVLNCNTFFAHAAGSCSLSGSPLTASCTLGACAAGFGNCDAQSANGCEADFATDALHCGSCAGNCSASLTSNVATATCSAGSCAVSTCASGYQNCDPSYANGCESVKNFDLNHCGTCSNNCAANALPGWATCNGAGACVIGACTSGLTVCPAGAAGSACRNLKTDVNNCGSCGSVCDSTTGTFCVATNAASFCSPCSTWCAGVGKACNATSGACY